MRGDLTEGDITKKLLLFALPLMAGNLLQQMYNVADTLIVGRFLGGGRAGGGRFVVYADGVPDLYPARAVYGEQRVFLHPVWAEGYGAAPDQLRSVVPADRCGGAAAQPPLVCRAGLDHPRPAGAAEVVGLMREYLFCIFSAFRRPFFIITLPICCARSGDSVTPLLFLGVAAVMNIALDLVFVIVFRWGVAGAAAATVLSQYASGPGILLYYLLRFPELRVARRHIRWDGGIVREIAGLSVLTCVQQSIMNLGILMVQGLVNSFGKVVMAAFAAAVKIDSFAYMPVQDFGNAFSTFIAQNYGAGKAERIRRGIKSAALSAFAFCAAISLAVCALARPLMGLFVDAGDTAIIEAGVGYLRIEGRSILVSACCSCCMAFIGRSRCPDVSGADGILAGYACGIGLRVVGCPCAGRDRHLDVGANRLGAGRCGGRAVLLQKPDEHPCRGIGRDETREGGIMPPSRVIYRPK